MILLFIILYFHYSFHSITENTREIIKELEVGVQRPKMLMALKTCSYPYTHEGWKASWLPEVFINFKTDDKADSIKLNKYSGMLPNFLFSEKKGSFPTQNLFKQHAKTNPRTVLIENIWETFFKGGIRLLFLHQNIFFYLNTKKLFFFKYLKGFRFWLGLVLFFHLVRTLVI